MFTLPVRIFIVVAGSAYGIYKIANGYVSGYVLLFAAPLIVLGYFRYGAIRPACKAMERGDLDVARKHIETIKFPNLLSAQSKAYFHWINAVLAAAALVHEACRQLVETESTGRCDSRGHFSFASAEAMRRILIESARGKSTLKRGGDCGRIELDKTGSWLEKEFAQAALLCTVLFYPLAHPTLRNTC